jgi:hypothetical protein
MIGIFTGCDDNNEAIELSADSPLSISDNYNSIFLKRKGHWGIGNDRVANRSFLTSNDTDLCLRSGSLSVNFEKEISELSFCLMDSELQIVFEETISGNNNSSYIIPVTFSSEGKYRIEASFDDKDFYLDFFIK